MYTVKPQLKRKEGSKSLKRKARDQYLSQGRKAVAGDFRVVTIVWACSEGCLHPELFAFHKDTPSLGDVARQYHEIFDAERSGDNKDYACDGYRLSNASWMLLDENGPISQDEEVLIINHILMKGIWTVNLYDDTHKAEKRCDWCFQPNVREKCGECKMTRYCNPECQKKHWPFHKMKPEQPHQDNNK